jgi:hypothetical protein
LTACAFWMMKIITTMRPAKPAISPVRMPLIRVCIRPALAGGGAASGCGDAPLADGGGRVVAALCVCGCSVMAVLPSREPQ